MVSPAQRLTRRVSQTVRNFNCCLPHISSLTVCNNGSNTHFRRRRGTLHANTSVVVTAPKQLVDRGGVNGLGLSRYRFFILSRTSYVLSVKFRSSVVLLTGRLPTAYRILVFSTAVPAGVRALTGTLLGSPTVIGLTIDGPIRTVRRSTCIYCRPRGVGVVSRLFRRRLAHILLFYNGGGGIGRIYHALQLRRIGTNRVRSSLARRRESRVVFHFGDKRVSILITASVLTEKVSVSSVTLIVGCSIPRSIRSCVRHVNHATETRGRKRTVALIGPSSVGCFTRVRHFLKCAVTGDPIPRSLNRTPRCVLPTGRRGRRDRKQGGPSIGRPRRGTLTTSIPAHAGGPHSHGARRGR